eukprot:TRINITY_DN23575_c1_g1_i1.p1 TRINITY_DN23575_c1_g1~~TRINITY_DN23575_c1_g1_i1.p1  ORF type:complete len:1725 (-),score=288.88 TRINITY_DN23575_c1_g1_i1:45-5219(-)
MHGDNDLSCCRRSSPRSGCCMSRLQAWRQRIFAAGLLSCCIVVRAEDCSLPVSCTHALADSLAWMMKNSQDTSCENMWSKIVADNAGHLSPRKMCPGWAGTGTWAWTNKHYSACWGSVVEYALLQSEPACVPVMPPSTTQAPSTVAPDSGQAPVCGRMPVLPVWGSVKQRNVEVDWSYQNQKMEAWDFELDNMPCRIGYREVPQMERCLTGSWVVVLGASQSTVWTVQLANMLVPGAIDAIRDGFVSDGVLTELVDIVIEAGRVVHRRVVFKGNPLHPMGRRGHSRTIHTVVRDQKELPEAFVSLMKAPAFNGKQIRITNLIGEFWDEVLLGLMAVQATEKGWDTSKVFVVTAVGLWYGYAAGCHKAWCSTRPAIAGKPPDFIMEEYVQGLTDTLHFMQKFCNPGGPAGVHGCTLMSIEYCDGFLRFPFYVRLYHAMKDHIQAFATDNIRFLDLWMLNMQMPENCLYGHASPAASGFTWQVLLSSVCSVSDVAPGTLVAFEGKACRSSQVLPFCPGAKCRGYFFTWDYALAQNCQLRAVEDTRHYDAKHWSHYSMDHVSLASPWELRLDRTTLQTSPKPTTLTQTTTTISATTATTTSLTTVTTATLTTLTSTSTRWVPTTLPVHGASHEAGVQVTITATTVTVTTVTTTSVSTTSVSTTTRTFTSVTLTSTSTSSQTTTTQTTVLKQFIIWDLASEEMKESLGSDSAQGHDWGVAALLLGAALLVAWRLEALMKLFQIDAFFERTLGKLKGAEKEVDKRPMRSATATALMLDWTGDAVPGPSDLQSEPSTVPSTDSRLELLTQQDRSPTIDSANHGDSPLTCEDLRIQSMPLLPRTCEDLRIVPPRVLPTKAEDASDRFSFGLARCIASCHVVVGHLYARDATPDVYTFSWGFTWVPWFFMLSGFILCAAELRKPRGETSMGYVSRRLVTIYPVYALGLIVSCVLASGQGSLPPAWVLVLQAWLLQAWLPLITEWGLQMQCWFLSCLTVYWFFFPMIVKRVAKMSAREVFVGISLTFLLPSMYLLIPDLYFANAMWYRYHSWGHMRDVKDFLVVMLKFHPLCYLHVFVLGMLLARLRQLLPEQVKAEREGKILRLAMHLMAPLAYALLVVVFTAPPLRPPFAKLSARIFALLPVQAAILLGLAGLPGQSQPVLARMVAPLNFLESYSYSVYVVQFICMTLWRWEDFSLPFFFFLASTAIFTQLLVQKPAEKLWRVAPLKASFAAPLVVTVLLVAVSLWGKLLPRFPEPQDIIEELPEKLRFDGLLDVRLPLRLDEWDSEDRAGGAIINPSVALLEDGKTLVIAARLHRRSSNLTMGEYKGSRVHVMEEFWHSEILLGRLEMNETSWNQFTSDGLLESISLYSWTGLRGKKGQSWSYPSLCSREKWLPSNKTLIRLTVTGPEDPKPFVHRTRFCDKSGDSCSAPREKTDWCSKAEQHCTGKCKSKWCEGSEVKIAFNSYSPDNEVNGAECPSKPVSQMYLASGVDVRRPEEELTGQHLMCGHLERAEKNWILFETNRSRYVVYSVLPHVVLELRDDGTCGQRFTSVFAPLAHLQAKLVHAALRGSAQAVFVNAPNATPNLPIAHFLALMHVTDTKDHRYAHYAYRFTAEPPFQMLQVSEQLPLLTLSPGAGAKAFAFASGLVVRGQEVMITYAAGDREPRAMTMSLSRLDEFFNRQDHMVINVAEAEEEGKGGSAAEEEGEKERREARHETARASVAAAFKEMR